MSEFGNKMTELVEAIKDKNPSVSGKLTVAQMVDAVNGIVINVGDGESSGNSDVKFGYWNNEGKFQEISLANDSPTDIGDPISVDANMFITGKPFPSYDTDSANPDLSYGLTSTADEILEGFTACVNGVVITGTIPTVEASVDANTVTIPKGYISEDSDIVLPESEITESDNKVTIPVGWVAEERTYTISGESSAEGTIDWSIVTASPSSVLNGHVFYDSDGLLTSGTIETYKGPTEVTSNQTLDVAGKYMSKNILIQVSSKPDNNTPGTDTTDGTATYSDIREGVIAYAKGVRLVGTMPTVSMSVNGPTVSIGKGYTEGQTISITEAVISESANKVTVSTGYVSADKEILLKYPNSAWATATETDIRYGKTAYVNNEEITGNAIDTYVSILDDKVVVPAGFVATKIERSIPAMTIQEPVNGVLTIPEGYNAESFNVYINGVDTSSATATANRIAPGYTAYVKGEKITGNMPSSSYSYNEGVVTISEGYVGSTYTKNIPKASSPTVSGSTVTIYPGYVSTRTTRTVSQSSGLKLSGGTVSVGKGWIEYDSIKVPDATINITESNIVISSGYISSTRTFSLNSSAITDATVVSGSMKAGTIAYGNNNERIVGTMQEASLDIDGRTVRISSGYIESSDVHYVEYGKDPTILDNKVTIYGGYYNTQTVTVPTISIKEEDGTLIVPKGYNPSEYTLDISGLGRDGTATADKIRAGYVAYAKGSRLIGTMKDASISVSGDSVKVTAGYTPSKTIPIRQSSGLSVTLDGCGVTVGSGYLPSSDTYRFPRASVVPLDDGGVIVYTGMVTTPITLAGVCVDTMDGTAAASQIVSGEIAYVRGTRVLGTMPESPTATYSNGVVRVSKGYVNASYDVQIPTADRATYEGNVVTIHEGMNDSTYTLSVGTPVQSNTITPGIVDVVIPADMYTVGDQIIKGDTNLTADNIRAGVSIFDVEGSFTSDATAKAEELKSGSTAYVNGEMITGTMTSKDSQEYTPGTEDQAIAKGQYLDGDQVIKGDSNLTADNIRAGRSVFGVTGTFTNDATATAADIKEGMTAYVGGQLVTGTMQECSNSGGDGGGEKECEDIYYKYTNNELYGNYYNVIRWSKRTSASVSLVHEWTGTDESYSTTFSQYTLKSGAVTDIVKTDDCEEYECDLYFDYNYVLTGIDEDGNEIGHMAWIINAPTSATGNAYTDLPPTATLKDLAKATWSPAYGFDNCTVEITILSEDTNYAWNNTHRTEYNLSKAPDGFDPEVGGIYNKNLTAKVTLQPVGDLS